MDAIPDDVLQSVLFPFLDHVSRLRLLAVNSVLRETARKDIHPALRHCMTRAHVLPCPPLALEVLEHGLFAMLCEDLAEAYPTLTDAHGTEWFLTPRFDLHPCFEPAVNPAADYVQTLLAGPKPTPTAFRLAFDVVTHTDPALATFAFDYLVDGTAERPEAARVFMQQARPVAACAVALMLSYHECMEDFVGRQHLCTYDLFMVLHSVPATVANLVDAVRQDDPARAATLPWDMWVAIREFNCTHELLDQFMIVALVAAQFRATRFLAALWRGPEGNDHTTLLLACAPWHILDETDFVRLISYIKRLRAVEPLFAAKQWDGWNLYNRDVEPAIENPSHSFCAAALRTELARHRRRPHSPSTHATKRMCQPELETVTATLTV
jgi:hypothetical protein